MSSVCASSIPQDAGKAILQGVSSLFWRSFLIVATVVEVLQILFWPIVASWLPKATGAPTPVRTLILRRTFLTAGSILIFSTVCAPVGQDMKKAVASSTLFQTGFSMLTLGGKVGIFIHNLRGQQDSHEHRGLGGGVYFIQLQILVTLFCLCRLYLFESAID
ncbi:unnamed protein product [Enterobius vermicularis]|uniref:DUF4149 domain-containing protein n=1 Tax=Enterobius vermicularis TaxID=51028 RepID=A0A0N4V4H5_ENTVE|nr:unnamed protein product [Enterobius vermicularis]